MRCETVRKKLDCLGRQELAPRTRDRVEAHLSGCAECRRHGARQERLAVLLGGAPKPPAVPEGFDDRLMAAARQRQAARRPAPGSLGRLPWLRPSASVGRKAAEAAMLACGLLIGVFLGQQTWHSAHPSNPRQATQTDPLAVYELDYLTDAPGNSLAGTYLALTGSS